MNNMTESSIIENRKGLIERLLKVAVSNAIDYEEYQNLNNRLENLSTKESLSTEEEEEFTKIMDRINLASFHTEELINFKLAMERFGFSEENVIDFLAHENAHANKADELDAGFDKYLLTILIRDGKLVGQPSTLFNLDLEHPEAKKILKKITSAPEEYGNKLSPDDINSLNNLNK